MGVVSSCCRKAPTPEADAPPPSQRPPELLIARQELPAWRPLLTPRKVIIVFGVLGVAFLPIGITGIVSSNQADEIVIRYDEECYPLGTTYILDFTDSACPGMAQDVFDSDSEVVEVTVMGNADRSAITQAVGCDASVDGVPGSELTCTLVVDPGEHGSLSVGSGETLFVHYELTNLYQNHRRYVRSRSDNQLRQNTLEDAQAENSGTCDPEENGPDGEPIVPCGLIAYSLFNDTYAIAIGGGGDLDVGNTSIAWSTDLETKFGDTTQSEDFNTFVTQRGGRTILPRDAANFPSGPLKGDERFVNWMRVAALSTFRKLWGRVEGGVTIDNDDAIVVEIRNIYNTYIFGGEKRIVLSVDSFYGGRDRAWGIAYLVMAGVYLGLAALVAGLEAFSPPRKLGNLDDLSWNRRGANALVDASDNPLGLND